MCAPFKFNKMFYIGGGMMRRLAGHKNFIFLIIFTFALGVIIGSSLSGTPIFSIIFNWIFATFSLTWIIGIILQFFKDQREKRLREDQLIIKDLENWMNKTTFCNIIYRHGEIETIDHKEPNLPYLKQDIEVLKAYDAFTYWEKGKKFSDNMKNDGVRAFNRFKEIVDKRLKDIPLKKSLKIGSLSEPYFFFPRILESILEEFNNNNKTGFKILAREQDVTGFLEYWEMSLAWGDVKILNRLKNIIEDLIDDENVRKEINIYNESKKALNSNKYFTKFADKIRDIINDFNWNQKLKH